MLNNETFVPKLMREKIVQSLAVYSNLKSKVPLRCKYICIGETYEKKKFCLNE